MPGKLKTPDITTAQIVAGAFAALYPVLTLLGIDLSLEQKDALEELKYVALGLLGSDALIRVGRSYYAGKTPKTPPIADGNLDDEPEDFYEEPEYDPEFDDDEHPLPGDPPASERRRRRGEGVVRA